MAKRKRRASPAQIAARKAFAAKYGGKKRKAAKAVASRPKRPSRRKRRAMSAGKHRPVVIRKRGRLYRPKRSSIPSHAKFANPFLGGLAMIGNPGRRKRRKSASRKSHRRSRRSMTLRNPLPAVLAAPREMASKGFLIEAASVAAGFVLPNVILPRLPVAMRDSQVKAYASKIAIVAVIAGGTSMVNKRVSRALMIGGGVSILLDVWTDFVAPALMGGGSGVNAYYGDPGDPGAGVGAFYGDPGDPGAGVGASIADAFGGGSDSEAWG